MNKKKYPYLHQMKHNHEHKDLDGIAATMQSIYTLHGLTMDEVAALNYYLMKNALEQKGNAKFLEEKFGIKISELNLEGILQVQQALIGAYYEKIKQG